MTITFPVQIGTDPCGCLNEWFQRSRVPQALRCAMHADRYVRVESGLSLRRS